MKNAAFSTLRAWHHEVGHWPLSAPTWLPASRSRCLIAGLVLMLLSGFALAHGVAQDDQAFIERSSGAQLIPFAYLGA
jgi:hypothetical protein